MEDNPVGACNFTVDLGGLTVGLSEVVGLGYEPGARQVAPVTLRRGAGRDGALWEWARKPEPRTVTVTLLDSRLEPVCVYVLQGAKPVKWTGPSLDATSTDVAMEELVLTADGIDVRPANPGRRPGAVHR